MAQGSALSLPILFVAQRGFLQFFLHSTEKKKTFTHPDILVKCVVSKLSLELDIIRKAMMGNILKN